MTAFGVNIFYLLVQVVALGLVLGLIGTAVFFTFKSRSRKNRLDRLGEVFDTDHDPDPTQINRV